MATTNPTERYIPTPPPDSASVEMREWIREELDRVALAADAALSLIDQTRSRPMMFLAGDADDIILDTTADKIVNYTQDATLGDVLIPANPVTGEIVIPHTGLYRLLGYVTGDQPSNTQNETIGLVIDVDGVKNLMAAVDVNTVQTSLRTFSATMSRSFDKGQVLSMWMDATALMGDYIISQVSFEIILIENMDDRETRLGWYP